MVHTLANWTPRMLHFTPILNKSQWYWNIFIISFFGFHHLLNCWLQKGNTQLSDLFIVVYQWTREWFGYWFLRLIRLRHRISNRFWLIELPGATVLVCTCKQLLSQCVSYTHVYAFRNRTILLNSNRKYIYGANNTVFYPSSPPDCYWPSRLPPKVFNFPT